jgi:hypothetical protein
MAFVLVPHLDPTYKGMMPELLQRFTKMQVFQAEDGMKVRPNSEETEKQLLYDLGSRQWGIPELRQLLGDILPKNSQFNEYKIKHDFPKIGRRVMLLNARRIMREDIGTQMIPLAMEDITEGEQGK